MTDERKEFLEKPKKKSFEISAGARLESPVEREGASFGEFGQLRELIQQSECGEHGRVWKPHGLRFDGEAIGVGSPLLGSHFWLFDR